MRTLNSYLDEYAESHQHPTNKSIHNIAVPLIMWSLLGFLHSFTLGSDDFRLSYVLIFLAMIYYASFRKPLVLLAMGLITALMVYSFNFVPELRWVSLGVFLLSWVAQFYGHKVEGKKPSFFKDLLFLLIGPIWVMSKAAPNLVGRQNAV
ncbi:MAG: DUF962 domain-containing protein [Proteobacteria bacterium]|nr:MAG: DUF962 domain-containing protein [Pseudomonadota bacterium]